MTFSCLYSTFHNEIVFRCFTEAETWSRTPPLNRKKPRAGRDRASKRERDDESVQQHFNINEITSSKVSNAKVHFDARDQHPVSVPHPGSHLVQMSKVS